MFNIRRYYLAMLCVAWCLFNIFILPNLWNIVTLPNLPAVFELYIYGFGGVAFLIVPFIMGTIEFDKLGKYLTAENNLHLTFLRISPVVFTYLSIIILFWYPKDESLTEALIYRIKYPNWLGLGFITFITYFSASNTAARPFKNVTSGLLGLLAVQHLFKIFTWHKFDDGCRTEYDGYVDCDNSYLQNWYIFVSDPSDINFTFESLMAADLYIMLIYSLIAYIVISTVKAKISP